jgi:hypothetical protein
MLQRLTLATEYFLAQQGWTAIYALPVGGNLSDIAKNGCYYLSVYDRSISS